jgi:elongation factor Ts
MLRHFSRLASGTRFQTTRYFASVTAAMVKELRQKTGAPMMDCKKALSDSSVNGDIGKALDWLRAKGVAKANSAAGRTASEGLIAVYSDGNRSTIVEVNSETDFVGRNADFHKFVAAVASTAHNQSVPSDLEALSAAAYGEDSIQDLLLETINKIRENIVIRRIQSLSTKSGESLTTYVHGKVAVEESIVSNGASLEMGSQLALVRVTGDAPEAYRKLAMHVLASKPLFTCATDAPEAFVAHEKAIIKEQSADSIKGKKPEIVEKMMTGKLNKRLQEVCLLEQSHVAVEGSPVIKKYLEVEGLTLKGFSWWTLGGQGVDS